MAAVEHYPHLELAPSPTEVPLAGQAGGVGPCPGGGALRGRIPELTVPPAPRRQPSHPPTLRSPSAGSGRGGGGEKQKINKSKSRCEGCCAHHFARGAGCPAAAPFSPRAHPHCDPGGTRSPARPVPPPLPRSPLGSAGGPAPRPAPLLFGKRHGRGTAELCPPALRQTFPK